MCKFRGLKYDFDTFVGAYSGDVVSKARILDKRVGTSLPSSGDPPLPPKERVDHNDVDDGGA